MAPRNGGRADDGDFRSETGVVQPLQVDRALVLGVRGDHLD
jgi:hypothetical protein